VQADVVKLDELDRLYGTVRQSKGHIDIVFANAGGGEFVPLEAITPEYYETSAAIVTYLSPRLRFFHQGRFAGRKKRIPPHLIRAPDAALSRFYDNLLAAA
jgi:NAD(P)-dependent dehydrogenase (short-subunit alcohol dehydrogenase family)